MGKTKNQELIGKNLCEICGHYEQDSKFCRKILVIKPNGQYDYCKTFNQVKNKQKKAAPVEVKSEDVSKEDEVILEKFKDTLCLTCQFVNFQTHICKKFHTLAAIKIDSHCKGYKKKQEKGSKKKDKKVKNEKVKNEKGKNVDQATSDNSSEDQAPSNPESQSVCDVCQHCDIESGFCNKYLSSGKLRPGQSCKGYKKPKK